MFNPTECYITDNFQYILIHKNGCSSVVHTISKNFNYAVVDKVFSDRPSFTVLRDPWERTLSGLTYDIDRTYGYVNDDVIENINFHRVLYQPVNVTQRATGFISHINVQTGYLFDVKPSFYVMLEDLSQFLTISFNVTDKDNKNESNKKLRQEILEILNKKPTIKDTIDKYLAIDYYLIDRIKHTEILWDYSMGRMW